MKYLISLIVSASLVGCGGSEMQAQNLDVADCYPSAFYTMCVPRNGGAPCYLYNSTVKEHIVANRAYTINGRAVLRGSFIDLGSDNSDEYFNITSTDNVNWTIGEYCQ